MNSFLVYRRKFAQNSEENSAQDPLMESIDGQADHLVVLIHGLWGNPSHLKYLAKQLREAYSEDQVHILVPKSNSDNFTYDGIETGGERITNEIEQEIKKIEDKGVTVRKLSIVGYSLGGLLARYTVGLLYSDGVFDRIQPVNFTTFASPHLGVRTPVTGFPSRLWNVLGARTLSKSGRQMFLVDDFRDTGRPLLAVMADPDSVFIQGLAAFKRKTLYANIINDRSVVYYTAAIECIDPYVDMSVLQLNAIPETQDVILEPSHPVKKVEKPVAPFLQWLTASTTNAVSSIPWIFFMTFLLPFGVTVFLINAGVQSFRSARRIQQHESGQTATMFDKYRRAPFLLDRARNAVDKAYERAAATATVGQEAYLPTPPPERETSSSITKSAPKNIETASVNSDSEDDWPTLALTKDQFDMIDALDNVGFEKYRVHIRKVRHTHAAIIVRIGWRPNFDEGKVVVKHWVQGFCL